MSENNKSIGFFDSGVGGISVLKEAIKLLPNEDYVYLGDNKHAPYGNKSEDEIKEYSLECADFLYNKGVKAIVIACNTATSIAVIEMRNKYNIPVISIEPAVKPALENEKHGKILVMATPATLSQERYNSLLERIGDSGRVINVPCAGLADLIEQYDPDSEEIKFYLETLFSNYSDKSISAIVLGCTHYSLIEKRIYNAACDAFGSEISLYDGRFGVARQLKKMLELNGMLSNSGSSRVEFFATGDQSEIAAFEKYMAY